MVVHLPSLAKPSNLNLCRGGIAGRFHDRTESSVWSAGEADLQVHAGFKAAASFSSA